MLTHLLAPFYLEQLYHFVPKKAIKWYHRWLRNQEIPGTSQQHRMQPGRQIMVHSGIIDKASAWGFRGYCRALLPGSCDRTTPQPRLRLSPLLVSQRGVEPRRTRRSHNFQGCSVYRFRHCDITGQGGTAFLNGGRLSLYPLTKPPHTARAGLNKPVVSAQNCSIGVDRGFPTKCETLGDHHIEQLGPIHWSHRFLQDKNCGICGDIVLSRATSAASERLGIDYCGSNDDSNGGSHKLGQQGPNMVELPLCAFLCSKQFAFPEAQSFFIHAVNSNRRTARRQGLSVQTVRLAR